ncbi:hypothetical protein [Mycobacterium sp. 236(2023)]|uniref:hypothetical protein n=1 Tax=Mycobacterium sp. 236(2023) TaxID=3038163 RepID=UPI0024155152|nr:hypothetical protein [Mycobacterium sp. 236(2023)]MDG4664101.1 hypothetical protein [Mycobacterium sp. 236(2023)]
MTGDNSPHLATLADVSLIGDSPMMRVMKNEVVSRETHDRLASICRYEEGLD